LLRRLFEPLGYDVAATPLLLDEQFPEWGDSRYMEAGLTATLRLRDLLQHLFVLLPVLDDDKHYWVGPRSSPWSRRSRPSCKKQSVVGGT